MADSGKKEKVFHYTSKDNSKKILDSGVIKPSKDGAFGGGKVYVTKMPPEEGKRKIARNNYDGYTGQVWENREAQGSVDAVISIEVPANVLKKENDPLGRDIYTIEGPVKFSKK